MISEEQLNSGNDFNFNIADGGSAISFIENGMTYAPDQQFSAFNDEMAAGNWTLNVNDAVQGDGGTLEGWTLALCIESSTTNPCNVTSLPLNDNPIPTGTYVSGGTITSTGTIAANTTVTFKAPTSITLNAGFTAAAGSNFTAQIENCVNSFDAEETIAFLNKTTPTTSNNQDKLVSPINFEVYPNPFSKQTQINYHLSVPTHLSIRFMDINGRVIEQVLPISFQPMGSYQLELSAANFSTGVYFLQLQTSDSILTKKLIMTGSR